MKRGYKKMTETPKQAFARILDWHFVAGTRSKGQGNSWSSKEFAAAMKIQIDERSIRNWRQGITVPNSIAPIEECLFGDNPAEQYNRWREELRHAYHTAYRSRLVADTRPSRSNASEDQLTTISANTQGSKNRAMIERLIYALENHHTNPEGIHWIGQTLLQCRSLLKNLDGGAKALRLVEDLIDDIDNDTRSKEGLFDVMISPRKIANLIDQLSMLAEVGTSAGIVS